MPRRDDRKRNWAFIAYPESCDPNMYDILDSLHVPLFISPLHDRDVDENGKLKKPHWHILIMFDGNKSKEQVQEIADSVKATTVIPIESKNGYARYLCHLDNPEKVTYNTAEVLCLGGASYADATKIVVDKYKAIREMVLFCEDKHILSYSELLFYAMQNNEDWFRALCDSSTMVIKEYLKSVSWSESNANSQRIGKSH